MRRDLTQWIRFGCFLAAHGLVLAALYVAIAEPALGILADQQRRIEAGTTRLEQAAAAADRNALVAALDPVDIEQATQRFILGENDGLRNADLLTRLRQAADLHGIRYASAATLPPRDWNGRALVGARIEFTASTEQAARFLSDIEGGSSLLFIGRAKLSAQTDGRSDSENVTAQIDVYGVPEWPKV